jgi:RNA polymerase sigma factor (sigma-70 family)
VEASALQAQAGLARTRRPLGGSLLRLRSDDQLVALFRDGHDEAFRTIHDRYRQRLFAYTRQMLPGSRQDAEDALQDVFVRAYSGLRANDRELTLRAWLYRVAHNRCVDELRRPAPPPPELLDTLRAPSRDPVLEAERRDSLRRLVEDVRRLPDQQRSALLMRELGGIPYNDIAGALGVSVAAVKSLLVRARIGLAQAAEARDTACCEIREDLTLAHDRGVRPSGLARRHMHECASCRAFRLEIRGVSRQLAGLVAPIGPLGMLAHLLGLGGGGGAAAAGGSAGAAGAGAGAAGAGAAGAGAAAIGGGAASAGAGFVVAGHVATLLAAAVVTAGGAVELQQTLSTPPRHSHVARHAAAAATPPATPPVTPMVAATHSATTTAGNPAAAAVVRTAVTRSRVHRPPANRPATSKATVGLVKQLTSSVTDSVPATGGSGLGDGSGDPADGGTSAPTDTGASTTGSDTTPSTDGTSTGTDTGDSSTGPAGSSTSTPYVPAVSTTSDPNAATSSAGGSAGSPPVNGSTGTDSNTASGSSGSAGSGSNWPL